MRNKIKNFFFPKTNNLQYLTAFTIAFFFLAQFIIANAHIVDSSQRSWLVFLYPFALIALLASMAFVRTRGKPKSVKEYTDSFRMVLLGALVGSFSLIALSVEINSIDNETFDYYTLFNVLILYNIARSTFRVLQIMLLRFIKDKNYLRHGSLFRKFLDSLAKNYELAYDDRIPTMHGALILIASVLATSLVVSNTTAPENYQPLLIYIIVVTFLEIFQNYLPIKMLKD